MNVIAPTGKNRQVYGRGALLHTGRISVTVKVAAPAILQCMAGAGGRFISLRIPAKCGSARTPAPRGPKTNIMTKS